MLTTLSRKDKLDDEAFGIYANETVDLLKKKYPWKRMSPTVHKLLFHSAAFIKHFNGKIGLYSEEALEARNKDFKRFRRDFSRRTGRKENMSDVGARLLITSDPFIATLRRPTKKSKRELDHPEVLKLLKK